MKLLNRILGFSSAALVALTLSNTVSAALVYCEPTAPTNGRQLELSNVVGIPGACTSGEGNESFSDLLYKINFNEDGSTQSIQGAGPNPFASFTGGGSPGGSFAFLPGTFEAGSLLVFKFGGGGGTPDWFSFLIGSMTAADWNLLAFGDARTNALSHVSVYGKLIPRDPDPVPEPSTLALLGLGLVAVGLRSRRRKI